MLISHKIGNKCEMYSPKCYKLEKVGLLNICF